MKPLPAHITGFFMAHDGPPRLPDTWGSFRSAGDVLSRALQGRVIEAWRAGEHPDRPHASFHELHVHSRWRGDFVLVGNRFHPYVAAASQVPQGYAAPWEVILDLPELQALWQGFVREGDGVVLESDAFFTPMSPELGIHLSEADRCSFPRGRSLCLGDIVFNQWD